MADRWRAPTGRSYSPQGAQRVEDHADVDHFLQQGAEDRVDVAECGESHRDEARADAEQHALAGDVQRAAADPDRVGDAVDAVDHDHRVGGLGRDRGAGRAHRDPDVGERERRRVVDPVADHHDRPEVRARPHRADDLELLLGRLVAVDPVCADLAADRVRHRRPVTGDECDVEDPGRLQAGGQARRVVAQPVGDRDRADELAVHLDEHLRAVVVGACRIEPGGAADRDPQAVDEAGDSLADRLVHLLGEGELEPPPLRLAHECGRERVGRELVERGGEAERLVGGEPVERDDVVDLRRAQRERAGLVEQHGLRLAEQLDHAAALDDHPGARGPRDTGDERDRGGEDQRARRCDDEHGDRAHGVAARGPGGAGHEQRDREEDRGVAVGEPHEGRLLRLGLADEADEVRVRALGGRTGRAQLEGIGGVRGAAPRHPASVDRARQRLSGERRFVDDGLVRDDDSVDRHDLTGAHDHDVAHDEIVHGDLLEGVAAPPRGHARGALDERRQLAPGPARRHLLERVAAGQHQRDHRAGEVLAGRQGAGDRHERDRVHADVAVPQRPQHGPRERHEHDRRPGRPDRVRGTAVAEREEDAPADHAHERREREKARAHRLASEQPRPDRADQVADRRRGAADHEHLEAAAHERHPRHPSLEDTEREEREACADERDRERDTQREEEVRPERDQRRDRVGGTDHDRVAAGRLGLAVWQAELLLDLRLDQRVRRGRDPVARDLRVLGREALLAEEQGELLDLDGGVILQLGLLVSDLAREELVLGLARQERTGAHRERAGRRLGEAADDHGGRADRGAREAGDDPERHEQAVLEAEHELPDTRQLRDPAALSEHALAQLIAAGRMRPGFLVPHNKKIKKENRIT